jgi:hypothetical protein
VDGGRLRTARGQPAIESAALAAAVGTAALLWPRSWDDLAPLMALFSFPCCVLPSVIHLFAVPLLPAMLAAGWYRAVRSGLVPAGLVLFSAALIVGLARYLAHDGDPTELPPGLYLGCGWVMLAGAAACTAELRWRGRPPGTLDGILWLAVPVFVLKPFTDIVFVGV